MLCEADRRMTCEQLKAHPVGDPHFARGARSDSQFFYGVDWTTIRDIDAPFVPHLKSITDTSYFPTDEIDQTAIVDQPSSDPGADAKKDLAFLGYTCVIVKRHHRLAADGQVSADTKCYDPRMQWFASLLPHSSLCATLSFRVLFRQYQSHSLQ
jgi:hypothetical protein